MILRLSWELRSDAEQFDTAPPFFSNLHSMKQLRRSLFLFLLPLLATPKTFAAEPPFDLRDDDRVLLIGDTLIEREETFGSIELLMHTQFPERKFIVRNLGFAGDTPLGWSRASFDPPAKGWERLKEQLDLVRPTVAFIGYGMAASLQEMTDRSGDHDSSPTLCPFLRGGVLFLRRSAQA